MTQKPEETIAWMNTVLAYDTELLPPAYQNPKDAIRQLLATMAVMGAALNEVKSADETPLFWSNIETGEEERRAGLTPKEISAKTLAAYAPFKALAEKAGV